MYIVDTRFTDKQMVYCPAATKVTFSCFVFVSSVVVVVVFLGGGGCAVLLGRPQQSDMLKRSGICR